jgi:hypothetical protein
MAARDRMTRWPWSCGAGLISLAAACGEVPLIPLCRPPEFLSVAVAYNPGNVHGALVSVRVRDADSIGIRYAAADVSLQTETPVVPRGADSTLVPVLGLFPEQNYGLTPVAYGDCGATIGPTQVWTTGVLPEGLPRYTTAGANPADGYVAFGAGAYGLVIDNTGRVVWYHHFPYGPGLNFQAQPNGRYVARPPGATPTDPAPWVEIDPLGRITRTFGCARGLPARFHDLIAATDGSYWIMCDETRTMDLSALGGQPDARVTGTVVQHLSATGTVRFEWSPFDHFALTDLDPAARAGSNVNWTHGNAIDLDAEGNLLISFRSLNEIAKIDTRTGGVVWRMGGLANQFSFEGTAVPAFAAQHGLRRTGQGELMLLDNLGDPAGSRAERYAIDEAGRSVRLLATYGEGSGVIAQLGGTTQPLPDGHTLVAFGNGGRVEEYDAAGTPVWRIEGNAGYVFRAQRIWSLYQPGVGGPR